MSGEIPREEIARIDGLWASPPERASVVWGVLQSAIDSTSPDALAPTSSDILAFAVEYIGAMSIALQNTEFMEAAKRTARLFFGLHYTNPEVLYGAPDKEKYDESLSKSRDLKDSALYQTHEGGGTDGSDGTHDGSPTAEGNSKDGDDRDAPREDRS